MIGLLNHQSTRRRTICSAIAVATSGLAWTVQSVAASHGWCRSDPVVSIDGELADIVYDAPLEAPLNVSGPTQIVVTVPYGVQASLVLAGPGFGHGEQVSFANSHKLKDKGNDEHEIGTEAKGGKKSKGGKQAKGNRNKNSRSRKQKTLGKESQPRAGIDVEIALLVPADENFPVGVDFAPRVGRLLHPIRVEGISNTWITLAAIV